MSTYVMVAGSQHGGWCWAEVAAILRAAGHLVYTPTLTGLGERSHLRGIDIRLRTHVDDILQVLTYEELHDVVLVAHSYGGIPVGVAASESTNRLRRVLFLDALLPIDGHSAIDVVLPQHAEYFLSRAVDGWIPPSEDSLDRWGIHDERLRRGVLSRLTPHPLATITDAANFARPLEELEVPLTYLYATRKGQSADLVAPSAERAKASDLWEYGEFDVPHDFMITHPEVTADLLMKSG